MHGQRGGERVRRDELMQEKMKHAEEEAIAKAAAEQAAVAAARRKAYLASQERRRQFLESAAEPLLGASRGSIRSTTSGISLPCLSQVCCSCSVGINERSPSCSTSFIGHLSSGEWT